jgi:RNA polymerase sigma-70 factor (sigma-E family)
MTNQDDFAEYFAARQVTLRRTAYLLCGDWHWAEDLTQTAFISLAAGWHRLRDPGAMDAYTRTCLLRAYLRECRRAFRRRERVADQVPEPRARPHGQDDRADAVASRIVFADALRQLPPRQRATLVCRYYQELDVAATAAAMRCSEGTVKSQTARGLDALRKALQAEDDELRLLIPAGEPR